MNQSKPSKNFISRPRNIWQGSCFALAGIAVAVAFVLFLWNNSISLEQIKLVAREKPLAEAETLVRTWVERHPDDANGMVVLGQLLQKKGEFYEAIDVYRRIPVTSVHSVESQLSVASIYVVQGRLDESEKLLRTIKVDESHSGIADEIWATLLTYSGRRWESMPYVRRTLNSTANLRTTLIYLAIPEDMPAPPQEIFVNMLHVHDALDALGCSRFAVSVGQKEKAFKLVRESLAMRPDLVESYVCLGSLLLDSGNNGEFDSLFSRLPKTADEHPSIWFLRGRRSQEARFNREAIRCYWETLRRQPNSGLATYQLGQLLAAEGRVEDANILLKRSERLAHLALLAGAIYDHGGSEKDFVECAQLTFDTGRLKECRGWCELLLKNFPSNTTIPLPLKTLMQNEDEKIAWILPEQDLAALFDFSSYPLPKLISSERDGSTDLKVTKQDPSRISFSDDADRLGVHFVYFNSDDPTTEGKRMFEYTGGGVAALDYDHDGWCDIYFSQGTAWPPDESDHDYQDVMFRNLAGTQMQDVSDQVGIQDFRFGQGVASGDYDNDGFSDLYVANIDGNQFYRNNGDGTFVNMTESSRLGRHRHWTTSCFIADLNGDSLPDVYDATFIEGAEIFTKICLDSDGKPRSCSPTRFAAAPDHVYLNQGDGTFLDKTTELGFDVPNGDGLGVVAADFDNTGTMSVFVANDQRANFFFAPDHSNTGQLHFSEIGLVSGLAYDDTGAAQACMGVATGDANNDGLIDLFVTNFYNESNTLYLNLGSRSFADRARSTGLRDPSWSMLGFGTQFIDADRDGWEDLVLTNGHVDDFTYKNIPYRMRPQFFQNQNGRFVERFGKEIGVFFDGPKLGRGLARMDWNRDGLNDIVISHIGENAALLTNQTEHAGCWLGLKLVGTSGSRDAVGTRVTVKAAGNFLTRQIVGGGGYQATNENRLEFGLNRFAGNVDIVIHWMGGVIETFEQLPTNREYLAIEGRGNLLRSQLD